MKSVAIIGAGPAGIVAARKLLQNQQFSVEMFEKTTQVGGSWAPDSIINPKMRTNQSKFIMSFSDLSWEFIAFENGHSAPIYPQAFQVRQYINTYYERFILPHDVVHFRTEVESVEQVFEKEGDQERRWRLHFQTYSDGADGQISERTFDYVVMAPGIYNIPKQLPPYLCEDAIHGSKVPILHSTKYRSLGDIEPAFETLSAGKRKVLVVGGSHSGGDIASLLALQISNAQYSPKSTEKSRRIWKNVEVVHVSSHEMCALPEFIRDASASACTFQPADFVLFNRSSRPADPPPSFTVGLVTPEKVKASRKIVQTLIDGNEGILRAPDNDHLAPIGIMGDMYTQFLKTDRIVQLRGTLRKLCLNERGVLDATIESPVSSSTNIVENVCAVIHATGFDVPSSFPILSEDIKAALGFDASSALAPVLLGTNFLLKTTHSLRLL